MSFVEAFKDAADDVFNTAKNVATGGISALGAASVEKIREAAGLSPDMDGKMTVGAHRGVVFPERVGLDDANGGTPYDNTAVNPAATERDRAGGFFAGLSPAMKVGGGIATLLTIAYVASR